jgi:hypothetical protein
MGAFDNAMQGIRDRSMDDDRKAITDKQLAGTGWQRATRRWSEYPIGTKARQSWEGGHWVKIEHGWKWHCGSTFPYPGGADQVMLPDADQLTLQG